VSFYGYLLSLFIIQFIKGKALALLHGGQLSTVAKQFHIPQEQWLDLSTGIAPFSYPLVDIPVNIWQDLPTISEALIKVTQHYYGADYCWPLAGSQQLIEKLPSLWLEKKSKVDKFNKHVYLPKAGYKEHQRAWKSAGYKLHYYQKELPSQLQKNSVVVVINPNNPRNDTFTVECLLTLQKECQRQQSLLIIDEAFADIFPKEFSFTSQLNSNIEDVIILRSFGKFFGLAGIRIGFVCSNKYWCETIQETIGPWSINGPALYIAQKALSDKRWQQEQKIRLQEQSKRQVTLLKQYMPLRKIESNALFITLFMNNAPEVYSMLCQQAVYVRLTDEKDALRVGIANEVQLKQLQQRLKLISFDEL